MQAVQIRATYAGDQTTPPDETNAITIHAVIDDNGQLTRRRFFGCYIEDHETSPFILEPPVTGRKGQLSWGDGGFRPYDVNVFEKRMISGEQFTVWPRGNEYEGQEWTYRIARVDDLMKAT